nr:copper resistance protein B [Simiduia aestuariiviva]
MSHAWADSAQFSGEFDQLEARSQGLLLWDGELFFGNASNRALVLKTAAELPNRLLGSHELQLLVQTALNNRWQVRAGVRMDTYPDPTRSWGVVSFTGENALGTALEITGFAHGENQSLLLGAEHVFQLKPRLELIPKAEVVFNSHDDVATSVGAGLSTLELGARLRYHYTAAVKPYVGINWITSYGNSRDLLNAEGARAQNFTLRAGFSWAF